MSTYQVTLPNTLKYLETRLRDASFGAKVDHINPVSEESLEIVTFEPLSSAEQYELNTIVIGHDEWVRIKETPDVTPKQLRLALIASGISLESIDTIISSMPEEDRLPAQISWDHAIAFERGNPLVLGVAALLGLNTSQLDDLWALALTL